MTVRTNRVRRFGRKRERIRLLIIIAVQGADKMKRFNIQLTDAARDAAKELEKDDKFIRFAVARSGCCSMAVNIYPDTERITDEIIEVDGIRILTRNEYPELVWNGTINYKSKGLHKGFYWR